MAEEYTIPSGTRIGHVHLKVADLDRAMDFYVGLLGFRVVTRHGDQAVFISAGGYHHHIALNTWFSKDAPRASREGVGLFHTAILFPERRDLAVALQRLLKAEYPLTGASYHGVSEALYLKLCIWTIQMGKGLNSIGIAGDSYGLKIEDGSIQMYTRPLDLEELLKVSET